MTQLTGRCEAIFSFTCRHTFGHGVKAVVGTAASTVGEFHAFVRARVEAVALEVADALVFGGSGNFRQKTLGLKV